MSDNIKDKVIVITGASSGLGAASEARSIRGRSAGRCSV